MSFKLTRFFREMKSYDKHIKLSFANNFKNENTTLKTLNPKFLIVFLMKEKHFFFQITLTRHPSFNINQLLRLQSSNTGIIKIINFAKI